ncbi:F-box only protein 36 isoform X9 [Canis lupus familiaris]|uniref:F-box only protein 36 isoform X9 n=1 Tax=Canis lupus familiaris TaxID=9615 RepID=UPI0018F7875B|nr:F-box only protein 36 isoform X9 [Canis lupus familiaris]
MASWLPETLFEIVGQGPAPSKDYYQLLVTRSQVIFRWWKISLRSEYRSAKPGETKDSHGAFLENSHLQDVIQQQNQNLNCGSQPPNHLGSSRCPPPDIPTLV